jgi:hypothetical protein
VELLQQQLVMQQIFGARLVQHLVVGVNSSSATAYGSSMLIVSMLVMLPADN